MLSRLLRRRWLSERRHPVILSSRCIHQDVHSQLVPQPVDLLLVYEGLIVSGKIKRDIDQIRAIMELRRLRSRLENYSPPVFASKYYQRQSQAKSKEDKPWYETSTQPPPGIRAIVKHRSHAEELADLDTPKGLLLTGPPGSGKSFLVDLWYNSLPTPYKVRKHYNQLVLEIFRAVWDETQRRSAQMRIPQPAAQETRWTRTVRARWRNLFQVAALPSLWNPTVPTYGSQAHDPPMAFVIAHRLVLRHWLLVFDEIQLLDVSSAGLIADVLSWFWRMGGVVVSTSNKIPEELYKNGVQRERLEPFVEALKVRCPVLVMRDEKDWRRETNVGRNWFTFGQRSEFEDAVKKFGEPHNDGRLNCVESPVDVLRVFGRQIDIPWSIGDTCRFKFSTLCDETLGPADYLTIASTYRTVIITDIPIIHMNAKDQGRRFISVIDALYESRCRLVCLAETAPDGLFFPDALTTAQYPEPSRPVSNEHIMMAEAVSETRQMFRPNVSSYDTILESTPAPTLALDSLSVFSGEEEKFAYKRAVSRLLEMTSQEYANNTQWIPLANDLRKWESTTSSPQRARLQVSLAAGHSNKSRCDREDDDFAIEAAAYDGGVLGTRKERPNAPRLKPDHVWGVREDWGKRAGIWGQGTSAHQKPEHHE
ncbi:hypothetical protein BD410DRAFT_716262 [Rickenella mellea]|uniref:AFG1-like ATPase n=1 Tax=Rickenella mellea TaxID=50990 RepID=A0A4Y7QGN2_9AGAM|nr:hypothetical protein BD410DRAFT_716262 [Rickenella mellea]